MKVTQVVPEAVEVELDEVLARIDDGQRLEPFDAELVDFTAGLSRALSKAPSARAYPEIQALAFWMRRAEVHRLRDAFTELATPDTLLVPGGLVFHVPPANVDTMFVYSWLLSLLVGNRNLVRLSSRESPVKDAIVGIITEAMADAPDSVRNANAMITYERDDAITGAISRAADVRVIWGGDDSVRAIRNTDLNPRGREIGFADRYSYAAISSNAYAALNEEERDELATHFYNDAFWFNQLGCSSPRLLVWVGPDEYGDDFFGRVAGVTEAKNYAIETGTAIQKNLARHQWAAAGDIASSEWVSNSVVTASLDSLSVDREDHPGGGMFLQYQVEALSDIAGFVTGRDQTLSHFGFDRDELVELVRIIGGRGLDRVVPMGTALSFNRYWDGYDLLSALTTRVYVQA